jgi:hypothetical protein
MTNGSASPAQPLNPVVRPALVGGGALLLVAVPLALVWTTTCRGGLPPATALHGSYVFELESVDDPDCYYGSAFNGGPVVFGNDGSDQQPIVLTQTYDWQDGCTWESREVLTPRGARVYSYEYTEHVVSCEPDATPARACTRRGAVTVAALDTSSARE